jgi:hypothetical protein
MALLMGAFAQSKFNPLSVRGQSKKPNSGECKICSRSSKADRAWYDYGQSDSRDMTMNSGLVKPFCHTHICPINSTAAELLFYTLQKTTWSVEKSVSMSKIGLNPICCPGLIEKFSHE